MAAILPWINEMQTFLVKKLMTTLVLKCQDSPELANEVNELIKFIYDLTPFIADVQQLNTKVTPLMQVLNIVGTQELPEDAFNWIQQKMNSIKNDMAHLWQNAEHIVYPLNEEKKTIQQLAFNSANETKKEENPFDAVADADDLIDKTHQFYVDALAQFAALAEEQIDD